MSIRSEFTVFFTCVDKRARRNPPIPFVKQWYHSRACHLSHCLASTPDTESLTLGSRLMHPWTDVDVRVLQYFHGSVFILSSRIS